MMKEQVEKIYEEQGKGKLKSALFGIAAYFMVMGIVSLFFGSPFPYKEQKILGQVLHSGWIIEKWYLLIVCAILGVIAGVGSAAIKILKELSKLDYDFLHNCDVERYLETMKFAVSYGKELHFKGHQETVFNFMQQRYVMALIAKDHFEEAEAYLSTQWVGNKNTGQYKQCRTNVGLITYYYNGNVQEFNKLYQQAPAVFKKNKLFRAYSLILKKQLIEAVELLSSYKENKPYNEVSRNALLGRCYAALGNIQSAKECREYVAEHGNTMPCKEQAEEWLLMHSGRLIGEGNEKRESY